MKENEDRIFYAYDKECWEDIFDESFSVSMTPESEEDCNLSFKSQEEFFKWYYK